MSARHKGLPIAVGASLLAMLLTTDRQQQAAARMDLENKNCRTTPAWFAGSRAMEEKRKTVATLAKRAQWASVSK